MTNKPNQWLRGGDCPPCETVVKTLDFFGQRAEVISAHLRGARGQRTKRVTRFNYQQGPMTFLADQIVKGLDMVGHPAFVHTVLRSDKEQEQAFITGRSKARAFQSPHQYFEAGDIIHQKYFWFHGRPKAESDLFFDTLYASAQTVAEKYGVEFEYGYEWGWDPAHIELKDWRKVRDRIGRRHPTTEELSVRFAEVLPDVYLQHLRSKSGRLSASSWLTYEGNRPTKRDLLRSVGEFLAVYG